ncbi:ShlB/FhaC/HecB family hemolysin secretion/activation protein [Merismopedia glauca]|nr:ShlB/FhaC/HecB family hemolysin secretion/activation protein [Merismopedia glauca]
MTNKILAVSLGIILTFNFPVLSQTTSQIIEFSFAGNRSFSNEELQLVVAPYLGLEVDLSNLVAVRQAITKFYRERGYPSAIALIPLQEIQGGVVKIEVKEGKLTQVKVTGNSRLSNDYLTGQINVASPLNVNDLENQLQLIKQNPLIEDLKGELVAGDEVGTAVLKLQIQEIDWKSWRYSLDNYASPVSGKWQHSVTYVNPSLRGRGDTLGAKVTLTEGGSNYQVFYEFPVQTNGAAIDLNFSKSQRQIVEKPISVLDLQSEAQKLSIGYKQPLVRQPQQKVNLNFGVDWQSSETFLDGERFPFEQTSDNGKTEIITARLGQEWSQQNSDRAIFVNSKFSVGTGTKSQSFFSWVLTGEYYQKIGNLTAKAKIGLQLATPQLFPTEQFALGGIDTVRGYRFNEFLSNNGMVGNLELQIPVSRNLQVDPFLDFGQIWGDNRETIGSAGVSTVWKLNSNLLLRVDLAFPFTDNQSADNWLFAVEGRF